MSYKCEKCGKYTKLSMVIDMQDLCVCEDNEEIFDDEDNPEISFTDLDEDAEHTEQFN